MFQLRTFHIAAGDIRGVVLEAYGAEVDGMDNTPQLIGKVNGATYGATFSEAQTQFKFCPLLINVNVMEATGVTLAASLSIGTNGPNYNNILSAVSLSGLVNVNLRTVFLPAAASGSVPWGTEIYAKIGSLALGTSLMYEVELLGAMCPSS